MGRGRHTAACKVFNELQFSFNSVFASLQTSTSAAPSLACAMEGSAPTRPAATCAPVHEASSQARMDPDALVRFSFRHIDSSPLAFFFLLTLPPPFGFGKKGPHIWPIPLHHPTHSPLDASCVCGALMRQAGLQTCGHHVPADTLTHPLCP